MKVMLDFFFFICSDDMRKPVKRLKSRYGGGCMDEWLTKVFIICLTEGRIPKDW